MSRLLPIFSLPFFVLTIIVVSSSSSFALSEWRPSQEFVETLKKATTAAKEINTDLKDWQKDDHFGSDPDLAKTIHKCKYLLRSSGKALKGTLDALQDHHDHFMSGLGDDVESCLNIVEDYEELCVEGFRTNRVAQKKVMHVLKHSHSLVRDLLDMVHGSHSDRRDDDPWNDDSDSVSLRSTRRKHPKRGMGKCVFSHVQRNQV